MEQNIMFESELVGTFALNQEIILDASLLGETKFTFKNYDIVGTNYRYKQQKCSEDKCEDLTDIITVPINESNKTILVINTDLIWDKKTNYYSNNKSLEDFASDFVRIQYQIDDQVYSDKSKSITPKDANDFIAFTVPKDIDKASVIQCVISIRNKKYVVNLK